MFPAFSDCRSVTRCLRRGNQRTCLCGSCAILRSQGGERIEFQSRFGFHFPIHSLLTFVDFLSLVCRWYHYDHWNIRRDRLVLGNAEWQDWDVSTQLNDWSRTTIMTTVKQVILFIVEVSNTDEASVGHPSLHTKQRNSPRQRSTMSHHDSTTESTRVQFFRWTFVDLFVLALPLYSTEGWLGCFLTPKRTQLSDILEENIILCDFIAHHLWNRLRNDPEVIQGLPKHWCWYLVLLYLQMISLSSIDRTIPIQHGTYICAILEATKMLSSNSFPNMVVWSKFWFRIIMIQRREPPLLM